MEFSGHRKYKVELNVAPLIDIVFLLLIFFMLASTFIHPKSIDLVIQHPNTEMRLSEQPLVIHIGNNQSIKINGLLLSLQELESELRARTLDSLNPSITIQVEGDVPIQTLVQVMDEINTAGLNNILLSSP
jgi:biopolymer transport protein ExbD